MGIYSGEGWYIYFPLAFVVTVAGQDTFGVYGALAALPWQLLCSVLVEYQSGQNTHTSFVLVPSEMLFRKPEYHKHAKHDRY